jgi:hypothetical protein
MAMDSTTKAILAGGFAAGYVVGRNNKEKLALSLLSLATGRALDPMSLIGQGIRKLAASPQFEQLSESVASALEQRRRTLPDDGTPAEGADAGAGRVEDATDGEDIRRAPLEDEETEETDEQEVQRPRSSRRRPARRKNPGEPSAHAAGPKNPPAARAKAMGGKARAERATRRPGPKNPPAARAMARKAANKQAAAETAGKTAPARGSRHT